MKSSNCTSWRRLAVLLALAAPLAVFAGEEATKELTPPKKAKVRRLAKPVTQRDQKVEITGSRIKYSARDLNRSRSPLAVTVIDRRALDRTGRPNLTEALVLNAGISRGR